MTSFGWTPPHLRRPIGATALRALAAWTAALLLSIAAPLDAAAQPKTRIAVTAFENKVKSQWWDPSWKIGEGLAEMLVSELVKTGRFIVVERQGLGDVVGEQALGQSGLVRGETAARTGQVLGAQVIVRGAVTEFESRASGAGIGVRTERSVVDLQAENAHVAIDLRLIDTASGQVIASHNVSKNAPATGGALGVRSRSGRVSFGGDLYHQTPIGTATRAAIAEAVGFVAAHASRASPASFAVVKVEGTSIYINAGSSANVKVGDVFQVYAKGEDLTDPDSGLKLGSSDRLVGSVQISEVQEQFSIATIRDGAGVMKRGDRVKAR